MVLQKIRDSVLWHVLSGEAIPKIGSFFEILSTEHLVPPLPPYGHLQNASTQAFTPHPAKHPRVPLDIN